MGEPDQPTDGEESTAEQGEQAEQPSAREVLGTDLPSSGAERNDDTSGGDDEIVSPR